MALGSSSYGITSEAVGEQIRTKLDELYPERLTEEYESPGVLLAPHHAHLVDLGRKADIVLEVLPALGDFVPAGAPLVHI